MVDDNHNNQSDASDTVESNETEETIEINFKNFLSELSIYGWMVALLLSCMALLSVTNYSMSVTDVITITHGNATWNIPIDWAYLRYTALCLGGVVEMCISIYMLYYQWTKEDDPDGGSIISLKISNRDNRVLDITAIVAAIIFYIGVKDLAYGLLVLYSLA